MNRCEQKGTGFIKKDFDWYVRKSRIQQGSSRKEVYKSLIKKEESCLLNRKSSIFAGGSIIKYLYNGDDNPSLTINLSATSGFTRSVGVQQRRPETIVAKLVAAEAKHLQGLTKPVHL